MSDYTYPGSTKVKSGWEDNLPEYMEIRDVDGADYVIADMDDTVQETVDRYYDDEYYRAVVNAVMDSRGGGMFVDDFVEYSMEDENNEAFGASVEEVEERL